MEQKIEITNILNDKTILNRLVNYLNKENKDDKIWYCDPEFLVVSKYKDSEKITLWLTANILTDNKYIKNNNLQIYVDEEIFKKVIIHYKIIELKNKLKK
jgi:hypothetical protein